MKALCKVGNGIKKTLLPDFGNSVVYAIVLLRVIATCLITNTHYNKVYPSEKFAVGGLLGDVLFFAVSGFCYSNGIQKSFGDWYIQRWKRIYPSVIIMMALYYSIGFWKMPAISFGELSLFDFCSIFILPTNFLFFGAIIILYIPMYYCVNQKGKICLWASAWAFLYFIYYLLVLDKTNYVMNDVNNPSVLFLYFGAILIGIVARRIHLILPQSSIVRLFSVVLFGILYYSLTIFVRSNSNMYLFQIAVPLSLLLLCLTILLFLLSIEKKLVHAPRFLLVMLGFIANLTLEIYVVQSIIINHLFHIVFPLNWLVITFLIVFAAVVLKLIVVLLMSIIQKRGKNTLHHQPFASDSKKVL